MGVVSVVRVVGVMWFVCDEFGGVVWLVAGTLE